MLHSTACSPPAPIEFDREENEPPDARGLSSKRSVVVVGIIISQLINVHTIMKEDVEAVGEERGWKCQLSLHRQRNHHPRLVRFRLRLGIIQEINCA